MKRDLSDTEDMAGQGRAEDVEGTGYGLSKSQFPTYKSTFLTRKSQSTKLMNIECYKEFFMYKELL
jgi:hypothetical protein